MSLFPSFTPQELLVDGHSIKVTCVSMGNPHAVTYSIDGKAIKVGNRAGARARQAPSLGALCVCVRAHAVHAMPPHSVLWWGEAE